MVLIPLFYFVFTCFSFSCATVFSSTNVDVHFQNNFKVLIHFCESVAQQGKIEVNLVAKYLGENSNVFLISSEEYHIHEELLVAPNRLIYGRKQSSAQNHKC